MDRRSYPHSSDPPRCTRINNDLGGRIFLSLEYHITLVAYHTTLRISSLQVERPLVISHIYESHASPLRTEGISSLLDSSGLPTHAENRTLRSRGVHCQMALHLVLIYPPHQPPDGTMGVKNEYVSNGALSHARRWVRWCFGDRSYASHTSRARYCAAHVCMSLLLLPKISVFMNQRPLSWDRFFQREPKKSLLYVLYAESTRLDGGLTIR